MFLFHVWLSPFLTYRQMSYLFTMIHRLNRPAGNWLSHWLLSSIEACRVKVIFKIIISKSLAFQSSCIPQSDKSFQKHVLLLGIWRNVPQWFRTRSLSHPSLLHEWLERRWVWHCWTGCHLLNPTFPQATHPRGGDALN